MKKILFYALIAASAAMAQTSKTATAGVSLGINQNVTFGGNNFLALTSSMDTVSQPIVLEVSTIRPGTFIGLEYKAIAVDSNNVSYLVSLESRTCTNPVTSTGCPSQWMVPRFRFFQNNQHFADTLRVSRLLQDTTQVGQYTLIPTGNQIRLRIRGAGSSNVYLNNIKVVGY